jgi:hypothetical protein
MKTFNLNSPNRQWWTNVLTTTILICLILTACTAARSPTIAPTQPASATPIPPTVTPIPPTTTPIPPTATPVPPTATINPSVTATPLTHPIGMIWRMMAFDSESNLGIYIPNCPPIVDTWTYDVQANAWRSMQDMPPGGCATDGVYDSQADRTIVYIDTGRTFAFDDNTNTWTDLQVANTPSSRWLAKMAYDSESDKIILFGGIVPDTDNWFDETWAFDYNNNTWTKMNPTLKPPGLCCQGMAYDSESDRVIMWGGAGVTSMNVVWAYDYNTDSWRQLPYTDGPASPGPHVAMAYDQDLDRVYIYLHNQFYSYDFNNNRWEKPKGDLSPGWREIAAMVYIPTVQRLFLFGGSPEGVDDIWRYNSQNGQWWKVVP